MPTCFLIDTMDNGYTWQDFDLFDVGVEYATEVLEIPEEYLESVVSYYGKHIEITLIETPQYTQEDWYYALLPYAA
ncbi:MAG: hypothetical protein JXK05_13090 [Campylobacterales bacterium]|nr:hypothetical protein [Campylobacterales bacterium]